MKCKQKRKRKKLKVFVIILLIVLTIICYFDFYVNPQIINANTAQIKSVTTNIITNGVQETLQSNNYNDLITIEKNNDGKVNLIKVNNTSVNLLNTNIINKTQQNLKNKQEMKIDIPLGTFTGLPILNGHGPNMEVKIQAIGSINTKFISQFSSVGINQSCHKIYINITATVCVLMPLYTQNINVTSQVLVAECIIVGEIPNVYLNTDNLTNALNLIP